MLNSQKSYKGDSGCQNPMHATPADITKKWFLCNDFIRSGVKTNKKNGLLTRTANSFSLSHEKSVVSFTAIQAYYSTVTDFARFLGLSTSQPFPTEM